MPPDTFPSCRPPMEARCFRSEAIETLLAEVATDIADPELAWLFANCFPNTLDTTVDFTPADDNGGVPDTYVITGDIDAMWLRDSSAQVNPYVGLCSGDPALAAMVSGLIRRQTRCIALDPFANAFYKDPTKVGEWQGDHTEMRPGIHERKWELDSLCYPIRLAYRYWEATGDDAPFDGAWRDAMRLAVDTMHDQQRKGGSPGRYRFQRTTSIQSDTLPGGGWGAPVRATGMICSAFRNSDDAAIYLFNIPANLFAVTSLRQLAELLAATKAGGADPALAGECRALAAEVAAAVAGHGQHEHPRHGSVYAYECDGYGNVLFMDDAGLPSLLSIPYLSGDTADDALYRRTRAFALSEDNPYFFRGKVLEGLGSPHTAPSRWVWPLGNSTRGLTADNDEEIRRCLHGCKASHARTGFMHEAVDPDDPAQYSRPWFAWSNSLFAEFILKVHRERPALLRETK